MFFLFVLERGLCVNLGCGSVLENIISPSVTKFERAVLLFVFVSISKAKEF